MLSTLLKSDALQTINEKTYKNSNDIPLLRGLDYWTKMDLENLILSKPDCPERFRVYGILQDYQKLNESHKKEIYTFLKEDILWQLINGKKGMFQALHNDPLFHAYTEGKSPEVLAGKLNEDVENHLPLSKEQEVRLLCLIEACFIEYKEEEQTEFVQVLTKNQSLFDLISASNLIFQFLNLKQ